jgi:hypothetical protein
MPADDLVIQETVLTVDGVAVGLRQVGIKIWVDGSPWIGNIDLSFPYLEVRATFLAGRQVYAIQD